MLKKLEQWDNVNLKYRIDWRDKACNDMNLLDQYLYKIESMCPWECEYSQVL